MTADRCTKLCAAVCFCVRAVLYCVRMIQAQHPALHHALRGTWRKVLTAAGFFVILYKVYYGDVSKRS